MSKKAVWLSDIEFIEMHSSDWERLESEAFEADESVQAQLSENQQIVLNLLKKIYNKNEIKMNITAVFWVLHQNYLEDEFSEESLAYEELSLDKELQVVKVFFNWLEQEEE